MTGAYYETFPDTDNSSDAEPREKPEIVKDFKTKKRELINILKDAVKGCDDNNVREELIEKSLLSITQINTQIEYLLDKIEVKKDEI